MEIKLKANIEAVDKALHELGYYTPNIAKKITKVIASKIKARIKRGVYTWFKRGKGELKNYVRSKNRSSGSVVYLAGAIANTLEYGAKILAKGDNYLTFMKDGKWIRKKEVTITGRGYFYPLGDQFVNSPEYQLTIEDVLAKEIDKQWRRG